MIKEVAPGQLSMTGEVYGTSKNVSQLTQLMDMKASAKDFDSTQKVKCICKPI